MPLLSYSIPPSPAIGKTPSLAPYLLPILSNEPDHFQCPGAAQRPEAQQASWLCLRRQAKRWRQGVSSSGRFQSPTQSLPHALTDGVKNPTHGAIPPAHQDPEIGDVSEEPKSETTNREKRKRGDSWRGCFSALSSSPFITSLELLARPEKRLMGMLGPLCHGQGNSSAIH